MRLAAIQLQSGIDIDENLAHAALLIRAAARAGAQFIATPEMTHIVQRSPKRLFAEITFEPEDKGVKFFSTLAQELHIHLLIGSLAIKAGEAKIGTIKTEDMRAANRSFLFGPDGQIKARYDKIHLFDVTISPTETWKESNVYESGDKMVIADIDSTKLGLSICYDLRFPELYRRYAQKGAHILAVPAAFTRPTGQAHWHVLLRARAIETGSYVIAPAQGGDHSDGRATWGRSMIIDPWGQVIAALDHDRPDFICTDIDLENVAAARRKIPSWNHSPSYQI